MYPVAMRSRQLIQVLAVTLAVAAASGCAAPPTPRLKMFPVEAGPVVGLADVRRLSPGTDCVVGLTSGSLVRGRLVRIDVGAVVLDTGQGGGAFQRVIDADIASIGRIVGRSKPARSWIGAVTGALLS